jgi:UPF0271 protein
VTGGRQVDLNSDLGEGFGRWELGDDDALLDVVTSANVACGFHAGDGVTMRRVCERAVERGVAIGAQVGYRDLPGFGRRFIDMEPYALTQDVLYQLGALQAFAAVAGSRVRYVKPHGALYNAIVTHEEQAAAVVQAVLDHDRALPVLGLPGSAFLRQAESAGLRVVHEAFADRAYTPRGRWSPGACRGGAARPGRDRPAVPRHGDRSPVADVDGGELRLSPDSICVHGDTAGAVEIARRVRSELEQAGVALAPFT